MAEPLLDRALDALAARCLSALRGEHDWGSWDSVEVRREWIAPEALGAHASVSCLLASASIELLAGTQAATAAAWRTRARVELRGFVRATGRVPLGTEIVRLLDDLWTAVIGDQTLGGTVTELELDEAVAEELETEAGQPFGGVLVPVRLIIDEVRPVG